MENDRVLVVEIGDRTWKKVIYEFPDADPERQKAQVVHDLLQMVDHIVCS